jgi:hypothetical protein
LDLRLLAELNPIRQFRQYSHNKKGTLLLCSSCCIKSNSSSFLSTAYSPKLCNKKVQSYLCLVNFWNPFRIGMTADASSGVFLGLLKFQKLWIVR